MYYIASISGGVPSAVAADRAIQRYGRDKVWLWFADTSWEDKDLYRFLDDCMARWGGKLHTYCDGRTPPEVARDQRIIPNQKIAPCTHILKIEPFTAWLWRVPRPVTVLLGFSWMEQERIDKRKWWHKTSHGWRPPTGYQARIPGAYEDYPLLWPPVYNPFEYCQSEMGIEIPRAYRLGFGHNNCGMRCFRQGIGDYLILSRELPDRFDQMCDWEQEMQEWLDTDHTILRDQSNGSVKPLPLAELRCRQRVRRQAGDGRQIAMFEDRENCICGY